MAAGLNDAQIKIVERLSHTVDRALFFLMSIPHALSVF